MVIERPGSDECEIHDLRCEGLTDPLGIGARKPRLTWKVRSARRGAAQVAYRIEVLSEDPRTGEVLPIWDSGRQEDWRTYGAVYGGPDLESRRRYRWNVSIWDDRDGIAESTVARWETGLLKPEDWEGQWIAAPEVPHIRSGYRPCPLLRRSFEVVGDVSAARVYATALGLYRLWLNGVELTASARLRPGWTDYDRRIQHQTFDVAGIMRQGSNVLVAALAPGWYSGTIGIQRRPGYYGHEMAFLLQSEWGSRSAPHERVVSDNRWQWRHGPVVASDMMLGEVLDCRLAPSDWYQVAEERGWERVLVADGLGVDKVTPQIGSGVCAGSAVPGRLVKAHRRGPAVFDFGINLVGYVRVRFLGLTSGGNEIRLRHGEALNPDETVYTSNLRLATSEDLMVVEPSAGAVYEPWFAVHGFRYVEVWGVLFNEVDRIEVEAIPLVAPLDQTGFMQSSSDLVDRLRAAIVQTQVSNYIEVQTDCPQRDERLGWLGDAAAFASTAAFNFNVHPFLDKWMVDVSDAQAEDGAIPDVVPRIRPFDGDGAPGWADGAVVLPWTLWRYYGSVAAIERSWQTMDRYVTWMAAANPDGIRRNRLGWSQGDWLSLPTTSSAAPHPMLPSVYSTSPLEVVNTAWMYRSASLLAAMARATGRDQRADELDAIARRTKEAYTREFVDDGRINGDTQTVYAQAVAFGLVEGPAAGKAAQRLAELVEQDGFIASGLMGIPHVLPVLAAHGHLEMAQALLHRTDCPSWGYMIAHGPGTIWERWDGVEPSGSFAPREMNSFNHVALGSVGDFIHRYVLGLDVSHALIDGWVDINPTPTKHVAWANGRFVSEAGDIVLEWDGREDLRILVRLPPGIRGRVRLPWPKSVATLDGQPAVIEDSPDRAVVIGSGTSELVALRPS